MVWTYASFGATAYYNINFSGIGGTYAGFTSTVDTTAPVDPLLLEASSDDGVYYLNIDLYQGIIEFKGVDEGTDLTVEGIINIEFDENRNTQ